MIADPLPKVCTASLDAFFEMIRQDHDRLTDALRSLTPNDGEVYLTLRRRLTKNLESQERFCEILSEVEGGVSPRYTE